MFFSVRKHEYKKARKVPVDRKPRQAYTAFQLETLEAYFKVIESTHHFMALTLVRQIPEHRKSSKTFEEASSDRDADKDLVPKPSYEMEKADDVLAEGALPEGDVPRPERFRSEAGGIR